MNYVELLRQKAGEFQSIVSLGIDPFLERIPLKGSPQEVIVKFYLDILEEMHAQDVYPSTVKPNSACFEQYGAEGMAAMDEVMEAFKSNGIPVILDAKRGDIDRSSMAYAKACFRNPAVSAITVNPFMGSDSVQPFLEYCEQGKGVYILCRTSNPGAADFQQKMVEGKPLFMHVAQKIVEWWQPGVGAVVGATNTEELVHIAVFFKQSGKDIPLLIPGIGKQGGEAKAVFTALKSVGYDLSIVRINAGSAVSYAWEQAGEKGYAAAAVSALRELNAQCQ